MDEAIISHSDYAFRHRWMTLLSVDDLVAEAIAALQETNRLDNTYFFYFSDHGYHLGEFCMPFDKRQLYENDIRVPFIVRGPGIPKGKVLTDIAVSIDLSPTFVDLAGLEIPNTMDGRSLKPLLIGESVNWRNDFLVEYWGEGVPALGSTQQCGGANNGFGLEMCDAKNNTYHCIRTINSKDDSIYCEIDDTENFKEYYDHNQDPHQLKNAITTADPTVIQKLAQRLVQLKNCAGPNCNQ